MYWGYFNESESPDVQMSVIPRNVVNMQNCSLVVEKSLHLWTKSYYISGFYYNLGQNYYFFGLGHFLILFASLGLTNVVLISAVSDLLNSL